MAWTAADFEAPKKGKWTATDFSNNPEDFKDRDKAEQAKRSKMGTTKNMTAATITKVEQPPKKQTFWQKAGSVLKNIVGLGPLGILDKGAQAVDNSQLGKDVGAGIGDVNRATIGAVQSIGGDKVPILKDALIHAKSGAEALSRQGGTGIGSQIVRSLPGAASNLALAALSGGASVAPQLGKSVLAQNAKNIVTSPAFANSMLRSYGGAYNEGRESGANRPQAISSALLQAIPQSLIEVSGGVEQIPERVGQSLLKTIGRSALEEAGEELAQYPFEGLARKATYAPSTPVFSTKENAVINPVEMGRNALVGGIAGGLLGGGAKVASGIGNIRRPKVQRTPAQVQENTVPAPIGGTEVQENTVPARRNLADMGRADAESVIQSNLEPIQNLLNSQRQRRYNNAYIDWDNAVNSFDERNTTPEQRAAYRESIQPTLDEYVAAENELNSPVTPQSVYDMLAYGTAPQEIYDIVQQSPVNTQTAPIGGEMQRVMLSSGEDIDAAPIGGRIQEQANPQARIYGDEPATEIPEGQKERGFSRNVRTDAAMPDDIRQSFDEKPLTYDPLTNKETLSKAQDIMSEGTEAAKAQLYRSLEGKNFSPESVPLAKMIAQEALSKGDVEAARQVLSETAERLTEAGRFSQAAIILREADPETFLYTMQKQLKKLNKDGAKQYGKKWHNIDLTTDEIDAIQNIPRGNQQAYDTVWEQIGNRIAKELPSTGMEKFDTWRRMAMLLNPKTHIRNTVGNVIMAGMRKTSDTLGAALEKAFVPEGERTKSFGWSANKDIVSKVDETWDAVKKDILGESRWEIDNLRALGREKRIFQKGLPTKAVEALTGKTFDRGAMEWLNEGGFKLLNLEDNIFAKRAFRDALGQYLQANGTTEVTQDSIDYAKRRALEATFKQNNMLADFINRAKRVPVIGKLVEGAIPFTKTPANILSRAVEYSPLGLFKTLYDVKAGKTPATVIEDLSKGLTGSAITALGFWLASMGWAKVERNRSEKAEGLMQEMGDQPNSIITPKGSYTFDWAQPFAVPLAMGIAAQEAIRNRKDGDSLAQAVIDGIAAGGDTIFNMTMLQNIKQILGSGGSVSQKIMGIPISYVEQAIPSILGQVARTTDDTRRSTYDPNPAKEELNRIKSRIPGMSQTLEPALNIWGEEQSNGGAIQQFINPGYAKERSDDPVTNEVYRLYSSFKDNDMLPKTGTESFSADKVEYRLAPEQVTQFQREMGQENYKEIGRLISSDEYKRMTDEKRVKKIKKIVSDNYDDMKEDIIKASALKGN